MSKFNLKGMAVGEIRYFEAVPMNYRDIDRLRRNLNTTICAFRKTNPDRDITIMTIGDKLMVRRWK